MSKKDKAAAKALEDWANVIERSVVNKKKRHQLRLEDLADNADDSLLKRSINLIGRIEEKHNRLATKLIDAHQKDDPKELRKVASEIIRNIKPLESTESKMSKAPQSSFTIPAMKRNLSSTDYRKGGLVLNIVNNLKKKNASSNK